MTYNGLTFLNNILEIMDVSIDNGILLRIQAEGILNHKVKKVGCAVNVPEAQLFNFCLHVQATIITMNPKVPSMVAEMFSAVDGPSSFLIWSRARQ